MSPQIATIIGLVIMFIVATAMPINMGAVAFALAFIIGGLWVDMGGKEVLAGFPGDLFLTLVGITYLFAIAQKNGTIDLLVHWAVKAGARPYRGHSVGDVRDHRGPHRVRRWARRRSRSSVRSRCALPSSTTSIH
ncbi:hypothetical protein RS400_06110 [Stenotrophomonas maltophilia]|nr:hypothetical protein [Stenotrophomonas maltophilia]WNV16124.1 hypothetical protein RS400_06110 [Stenotrophomonas maltophilia]